MKYVCLRVDAVYILSRRYTALLHGTRKKSVEMSGIQTSLRGTYMRSFIYLGRSVQGGTLEGTEPIEKSYKRAAWGTVVTSSEQGTG